MIAVIDYGTGNLQSILNMLRKIGADAVISSDFQEIEKADKPILPGVGAFDFGITNLRKLGIIDLLNKRVLQQKVPNLGICLGMQLITKHSEEGNLLGLGWIDAETKKFQFLGEAEKTRIPHIGWNTVKIRKQNRIFSNMYEDSRFYFVNSYM